MLWILALHIIFMVAWFAGLFYLPRLFVYHADCTDAPGNARFKIMERKLYYYIMTPAAILTTIFGFWLLFAKINFYSQQMWMHAKLILVFFLWLYHLYCGILVQQFKKDINPFGSKFYRFFNEVPTILLIGIVIFVVVKP